MHKSKKQIKESFFNPLLHILPLLLFLVLDDIYGLPVALIVALPVALLLLLYVYYVYNRITKWYLISVFIFVGIVAINAVVSRYMISGVVREIVPEYICLVVLVFSILFRRSIQRIVNRLFTGQVSMKNNFNELYRIFWVFSVILFIYVHAYIAITLYSGALKIQYLSLTQSGYYGLLVFLFVYEIVRVAIVRSKLSREEWWPIVNEQGKIIGSVQNLVSMSDEKKYMHPIIRVILIDNNRIFLQKRSEKDVVFPGLWDTAVSNHICMGETVEGCLKRTARERYGLEDIKSIFLSNYIHETTCEYHYAYLFVACRVQGLDPNPYYIDHAKWWTIPQIEDNFNSGIFTENFISELSILQRSGLLESGRCECDCRLKETLHQNSQAEK